jgi:hypothetical protein
MAAQVAATTDSRQRTELEGALKNEDHKQRQLAQVAADFAALTEGGFFVDIAACVSRLYTHSRYQPHSSGSSTPLALLILKLGIMLPASSTHNTPTGGASPSISQMLVVASDQLAEHLAGSLCPCP